MSFPTEPGNGGKQDWGTPDELFDFLDQIFDFNLDAAATRQNSKLRKHLGPGSEISETANEAGLWWCDYGNRVFLNWPYGRKENRVWARLAYEQAINGHITVVGLCFARFETKWWEDWVDGKAHTVILLRPRVKFVGADTGAQVPSAAIVWGPQKCVGETKYITMRWRD
jgi:hypothetical protein